MELEVGLLCAEYCREAVAKEMPAASKEAGNPPVTKLSLMVREEAAVACAAFRAAEMWLRLKAPSVSVRSRTRETSEPLPRFHHSLAI